MLSSPLAMRHLKLFSQFSVMWVLVFVMSAGPLPLGVPQARAAGPAVTDLPGLANSFYTPKVFVIFDTSKSMGYRPFDPNNDPTAIRDDWDPNNPGNSCQNKFCIGKRALYTALPRYTNRIEFGLSGYSQYYQLTTRPSTVGTQCRYDKIALGFNTWPGYFFQAGLLDDLDGTGPGGPTGMAATPFMYTPPGLPASHPTRKWAVGTGDTGDVITKNVGDGAGGAGTFITEVLGPNTFSPGGTKTVVGGTFQYDWYKRITNFGGISLVKSGVCADPIIGYNAGACASSPCDLTLTGQHTTPYPPFTSGTDLGDPYFNGTATYSRTGPVTAGFTDACGKTSPYSGTGASCNFVFGGCNIVQTAGPYDVFTAGPTDYYDSSYTPPGSWQLTSTSTSNTDVLINTLGAACPAVGTVVSTTAGPASWQSLATGLGGEGTPTLPTQCSGAPGKSCTWTMTLDWTLPGEVPQHYCRFQRNVYSWQPTVQRCDYQTQLWTYNTAQGVDYCDYKFDRDYYSTPKYTYAFVPNDGDLLGTTAWTYNGNDDINGYPNAVTYGGGSFSNGDCPNLVTGSIAHPQCSSGTICKLTWATNTTVGVTNYPLGRYTGNPNFPPAMTASPNVGNYLSPFPSGEPLASLMDPAFPPAPDGYMANWAKPTGGRDEYWVTLMADVYQPTLSNPPNPMGFLPADCGGLQSANNPGICSLQYSYVQPAGLNIIGPRPATPPPADTVFQVDAVTFPLAPGAFSAVAATMPPNQNSGWGQLPDQVTPGISWQGVATNNALMGVTPATDGPLLKMLSKYDPVSNPTGLQMPDFGDYTPLTGSLNNVADYLKTYLDGDPYSGCGRKYYVVLLTDGEETPAVVGDDPVSAVTRLRSLTSTGGVSADVRTFVIGFGISSAQLNTMARAGGTAVDPSDPSRTDLTTGVAFQGDSDPNLRKSLDITFGKIAGGPFTRSKPVVNIAGTEMYVGYMNVLQGLEWQGKLDSIDIKTQALPLLSDGSTSDSSYIYLWHYGDMIDAQLTRTVYTSLNPSANNRIFFDYTNCSGGPNGTCVTPAGWNVNSAADQTSLESKINGASTAENRETIAFLLNRGVSTNAPEFFVDGVTPKTSRASDIFHAVPAIVEGASQSTTWPDPTESGAYAAFRADPLIANRAKTVYIGANDGMLHAVYDNVTVNSGGFPVPQGGAGQENWAYVPMQLLPALPPMRSFHTYGVDGSVAVADVCGSGFSSSPCTVKDGWKTLLVGALGKGGGGLYALDITDAANPIPKWEVSSPLTMIPSRAYTPRLGETWGPAAIARTQTTTARPWSVFVGGGVVPGVDLVQPWGNLFYILDATTGQVLTDGAKTAAFQIWDDPADPAPNGVASRPTLFRPGDNGLVQRAYFNDTEGKIWRMNLSNPDMTTWAPGKTAADPFFDPNSTNAVCALNVNGVPTPILYATDGSQIGLLTLPLPATTIPRPKIYNRPIIAVDTTGSINLYVGTGDSDNPGTLGAYDYFYALSDAGPGCAAPLFVLRFDVSEKVLSEPAFLNNTVFITTYAPVNDPLKICQVGHGFLYSFDARTGQPVLALKDPFNGNAPTSKLDLGDIRNDQLKEKGIPSTPVVRGNKLYVANERDPSHPRQIDLVGSPLTVKVRGWQRVK